MRASPKGMDVFARDRVHEGLQQHRHVGRDRQHAARLQRAGAPYDLIFANILAGPLKRMAPEVAAHHAPWGVAILSGILARQAAGVLAVYRSWGYVPEEPIRIGEWVTLVLWRG